MFGEGKWDGKLKRALQNWNLVCSSSLLGENPFFLLEPIEKDEEFFLRQFDEFFWHPKKVPRKSFTKTSNTNPKNIKKSDSSLKRRGDFHPFRQGRSVSFFIIYSILDREYHVARSFFFLCNFTFAIPEKLKCQEKVTYKSTENNPPSTPKKEEVTVLWEKRRFSNISLRKVTFIFHQLLHFWPHVTCRAVLLPFKKNGWFYFWHPPKRKVARKSYQKTQHQKKWLPLQNFLGRFQTFFQWISV